MIFSSKQIAIDFGTSMSRVYVPKKGVVVSEPTVLALKNPSDYKSVVAIGTQAKEMQGKSSGPLVVIEPMRAGVIANYKGASALLARFIQQATGRLHLSKPEAMVTISATATSTEKRALIDASLDAGLTNIHLIQSSTAAALGAGLQIGEPKGVMIADFGAGSTEIGVFSLGGVVSEGAIRVGGNKIDDAIRLMARREHGVLLGHEDVQLLKQRFLNFKTTENKSKTLTGQSSIHGTPKKVTIKQKELQNYTELPLDQIVQQFKHVLEQCPPDIISDIAQHGIVLCGGSAQIKGLPEYLSKKLHIACVVAENPELCAIKGAHSALTHLAEYRKSLLA